MTVRYTLALPFTLAGVIVALTVFLPKPRCLRMRSAYNAYDWAYTLFLFTYTDFKTIFFPIISFASASAPVSSCASFAYAMWWIWLHLLQCNVSNQYKTVTEDIVNRPWRPLSSGRITFEQAKALRWTLVPLCLSISIFCGYGVAVTSAVLTITMVVYDEVNLSGHWIGKNLSAVFGYACFEFGATAIMGQSHPLDDTAVKAILYSTSVIFTTIHAQDFADVEGDSALGRTTFPLYAPIASRWVLTLSIFAWSIVLAENWGLGKICSSAFVLLGLFVGARYFFLRTVKQDRDSYYFYNIWLLCAHMLPVNARWRWLSI